MSDKWEVVVGKPKKERTVPNGNGMPTPQLSKPEPKKKVSGKSKEIEEFIPPHKQKESDQAEKKAKPGKENKNKDNDSKKQPKKTNDKKPETPKVSKAKVPKSLDAAITSIDIEEFSTLVSSSQLRFSNAPLLWLKEIASFLNSKTAVENVDPVFANQSVNYPVSALSNAFIKVINSAMKEAGKESLQVFFEMCLTALANDMGKGLPVQGYKILTQIMARQYPEFCISSISKAVTLRNSYQNRPPIGTSLLWGFGQGGFKDLSVGLQAWQEIMLPLLDLKHYTRFVVNYLTKLLDFHSTNESAKLSTEQLIQYFDIINAKKTGLQKEYISELTNALTKLKKIYFKGSNKLQITFNQLLKKLPTTYESKSKNVDIFQDEMSLFLVECLQKDNSCFATWRQLYSKCNKQSCNLLQYIDTNWKKVGKQLKPNKHLNQTLAYFLELNKDLQKGKKKDDSIVRAEQLCKNILAKMCTSRTFPWLLASLLVLGTIVGLVSYDVSHTGKGVFAKSSTGKFLKDIGALEHCEKAWEKSMSTSARGYLWLETNAPIYYKITSDFSKPYVALGYDLFVVARKQSGVIYGNLKDYVTQTAPVIKDTVEGYAPGLIDSVHVYAGSAWNSTQQISGHYFNVSVEYLQTQVFIGEWAPEILREKSLKAFNTTQSYAADYYQWFHQQVETYSKIN